MQRSRAAAEHGRAAERPHLGHEHQVASLGLHHAEAGQEGDRLQRLAQAHVVRQQAAARQVLAVIQEISDQGVPDELDALALVLLQHLRSGWGGRARQRRASWVASRTRKLWQQKPSRSPQDTPNDGMCL